MEHESSCTDASELIIACACHSQLSAPLATAAGAASSPGSGSGSASIAFSSRSVPTMWRRVVPRGCESRTRNGLWWCLAPVSYRGGPLCGLSAQHPAETTTPVALNPLRILLTISAHHVASCGFGWQRIGGIRPSRSFRFKPHDDHHSCVTARAIKILVGAK
jgi:hypothetical protein